MNPKKEKVGKYFLMSEAVVAHPGLPLIELWGGNRVLIENHTGICSYSPYKILVKSRLHRICICGEGLTIAKMTESQLVICGNIDGISLIKREG